MKVVELHVSDSYQEGYKEVPGSGGSKFYFKYTGGTDGKGNVTEHLGAPEDIEVKMNDFAYSIMGVSFKHDPKHQLTLSIDPQWNKVTIHDADTAVETNAEYIVKVKKDSSLETFDCDPGVSNENP